MNTKSFRNSTTYLPEKARSSIKIPNPPLPHHPIQGQEIVHFSHPQHPLVQLSLPYLFTCTGCKEYGAGKSFRCQKCDFDLHEFCALAAPSIQHHPLHNEHQLVFYAKPGAFLRSRCDVCGKATRGYAFRCGKCSFEMHPCCAKFSRDMDFPVHNHTLSLLPVATLSSGNSSFVCQECKRKRMGRGYECKVCNYQIHAVCAKEMVNGLHAHGIKAPAEKPSMLGAAVRIASNVILGFIGGLIEGLGEGVGEVLIDNIGRGKSSSRRRRTSGQDK